MLQKNVQSLEDYIRNEVYKLCIDEEIKLNPQIKKRAAKNEKNCIFARSFKGFRRKDDNLYDLSGRSEPQIIEPSLFCGGFVFGVKFKQILYSYYIFTTFPKRISNQCSFAA